MIPSSKINIDEEHKRKLDLICLFNSITMKDFIQKLIDDYLKENPLPKEIKVTEDARLKVTK